ncbi:MAG: MFS transporter [Candidatus Aenigmarchaeota archaeon]|nr:MFS transporter [Candidatus Aenigmarchaeota archaeon]
MDQTKNVFTIQTFNSLINGMLSIVIPLLMIERKIDIVTIGFVFSVLPLVFQFIRLFFGAISDIIGRKLFFSFNSILNIILVTIYYFAFSPLEYLFGKITEGIKNASLWSVNRASLLDHRKDKKNVLLKLMGIANIAYAVGMIIAGFLIAWLFYENTLIICIFLGFLVIPLAFMIKGLKKRKLCIKTTFNILDIRKKSKIFKSFSLLSLIRGLSIGFISGYIFPLFLKENNFSVEMIGLIFGFNMLLIGVFSIVPQKIEIKKLILYGGILYSIVLFLLGLSAYYLAALLVVILGIIRGLDHCIFETIISKLSNVKSYGGDVGMLTTGLQVGIAVSLALSGFVITYFGFLGLFSSAALIYAAYFILTYQTFKKV